MEIKKLKPVVIGDKEVVRKKKNRKSLKCKVINLNAHFQQHQQEHDICYASVLSQKPGYEQKTID